MSWREKLKKIKEEEKEKKEKAKEIAHHLAEELSLHIENAHETASEFASVVYAKVRFIDQRHKEFDPETKKHFHTGGILLKIEKSEPILKTILEKAKPKTILKIQFPHPKALEKREGYDENVYLTYGGNTKILHWKRYSLLWLKNHLEEAYRFYLEQRK
jgi:hypothetical protein